MAHLKVDTAAPIDVEKIVQLIQQAAADRPVWIGFSGGMDSHVLAHLLAAHATVFKHSLQLIHINHGLQAVSAQWGEHCRQVAEQLQLPLTVINIQVNAIAQLGVEAAARQARYQAIADHIGDAVLLTAQHQQDQAETVMLQLLRGAGMLGLAAMQQTRQWQQMTVLRPLLAISPEALRAYAANHQLQWIEDPSNQDTAYRRNFLRHAVWPTLKQHWPNLNQTLARSAAHLAESQKLLDELAETDMTALQVDWKQRSLHIPSLLALSPERQRNALRYFLRHSSVSLPDTHNLKRIIDEVCLAAPDAMPLVRWQQIDIRRYRETLYVLTQRATMLSGTCLVNSTQPVQLSADTRLIWQRQASGGLAIDVIERGLTLKFRQGGEKIQLLADGPHHSLKTLFQTWGVPPWQRDTLPLLFTDEKLIAVVGHAISRTVQPISGQQGWLPVLEVVEADFFD